MKQAFRQGTNPVPFGPAANAAPGEKRMKPAEQGDGLPALKQAFVMLRPDVQWKNPVMFVVEVGAF